MKDNSSVSRYAVTLLVSVGIGVLLAIGLLILLAALTVGANDPSSLTRPFGLAVLAVSSAACGMCGELFNRRSIFPAYLTGTVCGAVLVLLLFIASFIPVEAVNTVSGAFRAASYGAVVLLSLLGAVIARPRQKKHARAHIKRRYR